jgi:hypothetical protein
MTTSPLYLVQYGRPGFVGRFRSALALTRGEKVVLRGARGVELGEVLVCADARFATKAAVDEGEILRLATSEDETQADSFGSQSYTLLEQATARGSELGLPLAFVDVEITLDGLAILHALPWDACDATALLDELAAQTGLTVRLLDLSRTTSADEPSSGGCGKSGCGSGSGGCSSCGTGGGCSTGSCSKGSVKSSEELTAYFADLRQKMEAAGMARTPLN